MALELTSIFLFRRKIVSKLSPIIFGKRSYHLKSSLCCSSFKPNAVLQKQISTPFSFRRSKSNEPGYAYCYRFLSVKNSTTSEKEEYIDITYQKSIKSANDQAEISVKAVNLALGGNFAIMCAKFMAWQYSGSAAMYSEVVHSAIDCANQALLLFGLREAQLSPDKSHQYGYGKAIYFWSLVSALGTFWGGAGITLPKSIEQVINPLVELESVGFEVMAVLGFSLAADGYVFYRTCRQLMHSKPAGVSFLEHLRTFRDPTMLAILYEDGAACLGVLLAIAGIGLTKLTGWLAWDGIAGTSIALLLASMGVALARLNEKFLIGQAVEPGILKGIEDILLAQQSINAISAVQSQWISPFIFSYKAEVDFEGTYLAARLVERYKPEFLTSQDLDKDLNVLLGWYAEDVMRIVEQEVRSIETKIREKYPAALFIELEPDSKDADRLFIDSFHDTTSKNSRFKFWKIENEAMDRYLQDINRNKTKLNPQKAQKTKTGSEEDKKKA